MGILDRVINGMAYGIGATIGAGLVVASVTLLAPIIGELVAVYILRSL